MLNKGSFFAGPRGPATPSPAASPSASPSSSPAASLMSSSAPPKNATEPVVVAGENRLATATTNHREVVAGARLTVGPGVKLKGAEIQDCDTLVVEGRVDATMNSRFIEIAENGSFDGKVNIDVAEIRGRFAGELTAREQIVIHATGCVSGKIRYGRIVIHEGGELSGDVRSLTAESAGGETGEGAARLAVKTA
ncbi:MAG: polymer-forming cytoskeletal protein [Rhodocyclaceae bacterium]|nr:polymer-forming cytoskeletal protein [Rhodocyclaceae bacterium]MBK6554729.1 polymer-forming cytoskeletal protein [Rhodocyclaceae bacterium]MBK6677321.1 polymer-forming cytoskeletal protein [Rhodocyclaceae bacterium]MBK7814602.1 polymer-forming cytoskeletal protein [Rhodocyclaceae bacterium]MBK9309992.1 polymer-forming cytoskeletal protein [Rhodocyclaceae bacterium]